MTLVIHCATREVVIAAADTRVSAEGVYMDTANKLYVGPGVTGHSGLGNLRPEGQVIELSEWLRVWVEAKVEPRSDGSATISFDFEDLAADLAATRPAGRVRLRTVMLARSQEEPVNILIENDPGDFSAFRCSIAPLEGPAYLGTVDPAAWKAMTKSLRNAVRRDADVRALADIMATCIYRTHCETGRHGSARRAASDVGDVTQWAAIRRDSHEVRCGVVLPTDGSRRSGRAPKAQQLYTPSTASWRTPVVSDAVDLTESSITVRMADTGGGGVYPVGLGFLDRQRMDPGSIRRARP